MSVDRNCYRREEGKEDLNLLPAACAACYTRRRRQLGITSVEIPQCSLTSIREGFTMAEKRGGTSPRERANTEPYSSDHDHEKTSIRAVLSKARKGHSLFEPIY